MDYNIKPYYGNSLLNGLSYLILKAQIPVKIGTHRYLVVFIL